MSRRVRRPYQERTQQMSDAITAMIDSLQETVRYDPRQWSSWQGDKWEYNALDATRITCLNLLARALKQAKMTPELDQLLRGCQADPEQPEPGYDKYEDPRLMQAKRATVEELTDWIYGALHPEDHIPNCVKALAKHFKMDFDKPNPSMIEYHAAAAEWHLRMAAAALEHNDK